MSPNHLKVFLGRLQLMGSFMLENEDGTMRILFHRDLVVEPTFNNVDITCQYMPPNGTTQHRATTIEVSDCKLT